MAKNYSIYALIDPRNSKIFYIGRTARKPQIRLKEHINDVEEISPKQERIKEIYKAYKGHIELVILQDGITSEKQAFTREVFWIEMFSMAGANITNASIDYGGVHFLTEYHLNDLPDDKGLELDERENEEQGRVEDNSEVWLGTLKKLEQKKGKAKKKISVLNYFKIEDYETFNPIKLDHKKSDFNFEAKRASNREDGRFLNHGFPITTEEITIVIRRHQEGCTLRALEKYFQRSRKSISTIVKNYG